MATMATELQARVEAVRQFNRFYTQKIGVLEAKLLHSRFSLTEVRLLYELAQRDDWTATALGQALGLDAGYLSRMLAAFVRRGLVARRRDAVDLRQARLSLSLAGRRALAPLEEQARAEVAAFLEPLPPPTQARVVAAMGEVAALLGGTETRAPAFVLREPRPGDLGWVVQRHGALYAAEYGWNQEFEALVADIVGRFGRGHDPARERAFIAERDGVNVGCAFVVAGGKTVARLRLVLVEPSARGLGLGARLVDECLRFAAAAGYRRMTLWTNSVLTAARHVYERAGFVLVAEEAHRSFGHELSAQTWTLALSPPLHAQKA
jgi:DNA-binding MarR family transcriptional regulator/GNAT superfamily N-acetyltransferase